jgi:CRISPR-associated endonuclease/helicase Cas3
MIGSDYTVESGFIPTQETEHNFVYDEPRDFQAQFVDWLREESEPIVALNAPTGSGKTATFHQLIEDSQGVVLLVYPTNALIRDQKQTLIEETNASVEHITSNTLKNHGIERSTELKSYFERIGTDVVITNPDILQAVVQGAYVDPSGRLVELFEYCEAVVYDEFHFYDEFSASGILLQVHIAVNRLEQLGEANIVLASATPDETYFDLLDELSIDYRLIESNVTDKGSKFRCKTTVRTEKSNIGDITPTIVQRIHDNIEELDTLSNEFRIAVICNSVKASNQLYNQFIEQYPDLAEYVVKDNGYDTGVDTAENGTVLITTSKAEVGLDHDIEYLHMDEPYNNPDSFIQRFGRAGRSSPATVHVYGLGVVRWDSRMKYDEFVEQIYDTMNKNHANYEQTKNLIGLRASYALYSRDNVKEQTVQDLEDTPTFSYWYAFLEQFSDSQNGYVPRDQRNIIDIIENSLDTLKSLRGRSYNVTVEYQRGDDRVQTDYSLLSAITQYAVSHVEQDTIVLDGSRIPRQHTVTVNGISGQFSLEYLGDLQEVKTQVLNNVEETELPEQFTHYLQVMDASNISTVKSIQLNTLNGVVEYQPDKYN